MTRDRLAFVRADAIWTADRNGGDQVRVIVGGDAPSWSPDHQRLAFARDGSVWVASADGSDQRRLTARFSLPDPGPLSTPRPLDIAWDPNDDLITFSRPEEWQIKRPEDERAEGAQVRAIFDVATDVKAPTQGNRVFGRKEERAEFWFLDSDAPAWSRDGKQFAFARNGDVWLAHREELIDPFPRAALDRTMLRWNWDWDRLAATGGYEARVDGADNYHVGATHLSFSPDGKQLLASIRRLNGSGYEMGVLIDTRTGKKRDLDMVGIDACFSPVGDRIAYTDVTNGRGILVYSLRSKMERPLIADASEPAW